MKFLIQLLVRLAIIALIIAGGIYNIEPAENLAVFLLCAISSIKIVAVCHSTGLERKIFNKKIAGLNIFIAFSIATILLLAWVGYGLRRRGLSI